MDSLWLFVGLISDRIHCISSLFLNSFYSLQGVWVLCIHVLCYLLILPQMYSTSITCLLYLQTPCTISLFVVNRGKLRYQHRLRVKQRLVRSVFPRGHSLGSTPKHCQAIVWTLPNFTSFLVALILSFVVLYWSGFCGSLTSSILSWGHSTEQSHATSLTHEHWCVAFLSFFNR